LTQRKASSCFLRPRQTRVDTAAASKAALRLFCFPHAGGAPSVFFGWPELLAPAIDVVWVQQPGRGSRFSEKPHIEVSQIATEIVAEILADGSGWDDLPFCFYGHSLGALVAFETARQLRRRGGSMPIQLMVGAARAPHLERILPPLGHLPEEEFVQEIQSRYSGIPEAVLQQPELLKLFLPVLRADFAAYESYYYAEEGPLPCPITAFSGTADPMVSLESMQAWSRHTNDVFTLHTLVGDHFFVTSERATLVPMIRQSLSGLTIAKAEPAPWQEMRS
jgi:medium-chain acyl-[acyl-carrier-protein] hydrolase